LIGLVIKDADKFAKGKLWIKWDPDNEMFICKEVEKDELP